MIHNKEPTFALSPATYVTITNSAGVVDTGHIAASMAFSDAEEASILPILIILICGIILFQQGKRYSRRLRGRKDHARSWPYASEELTAWFISAIPTITSELNLEVATTTQVETFERSDSRSILNGWLDLGTNTATIRVPVTYRFQLSLQEPWRLECNGKTLVVHAPPVRASLPVAFDTERMEVRSSRGWFRLPPDQLLSDLHCGLTPVLGRYATDVRRLAFVRSTCREAAANFVKRWLQSDIQSKRQSFTTIQVCFPDDDSLVRSKRLLPV